jgi:hypothetical protein
MAPWLVGSTLGELDLQSTPHGSAAPLLAEGGRMEGGGGELHARVHGEWLGGRRAARLWGGRRRQQEGSEEERKPTTKIANSSCEEKRGFICYRLRNARGPFGYFPLPVGGPAAATVSFYFFRKSIMVRGVSQSQQILLLLSFYTFY